MSTSTEHSPADAAARLRALHHGERPLVLVNAWDAWSARTIERVGHAVVATSSAALVASLGYRDHSEAPVDEVFAALARICGAVQVPVTADIEDGYGLEADEVVTRLLEAGAVGCNLEDSDHHGVRSLRDTDEQSQWLASVREAAERAGVPVVLNARIDVLLHHGDDDDGVERTVERANSYLAAGADCVYPITFGIDEAIARQLVGRIGGPVNFLAAPTPEDVTRLTATGARRISTGAGTMLAVDALLAETAGALTGAG